ncbi:MAG: type restriction enzyme subunit [Thermoanaerobaculia bacterium]|jgi:type I restriction enzyme R subunit|nr:type restriction enzyme subunit [Thermoanaerobaculia bacterium]
MDIPEFDFDDNEVLQSQLPAIVLLQKLGYEYLPAARVAELRGGRTSTVLLEPVLRAQLTRINQITFKGHQRAFSAASIEKAIQKLKDIGLSGGRVAAAEDAYDLLALGESFDETIDGHTKAFSLRYIDWNTPSNNVFHIVAEFPVVRAGRRDLHRPDLVLFVNGIPLVVIECKRRDVPIDSGVRDILEYQRNDGLPDLFKSVQVVAAINGQKALYATTATPRKFWNLWRTNDPAIDASLRGLIRRPLTEEQATAVFTDFGRIRDRYLGLKPETREPSKQDLLLFDVLRPERLLLMARRYVLFDAGEKKIARYQQVRAVENALARLRVVDADGKRTGGVVAHTQGSGKSLTMVMLAKAIVEDKTIINERIVLVTDRIDLDKQIGKTFRHSGAEVVRATSGKVLRALLQEPKSRVITTVINKFAAAVTGERLRLDSGNIFVFVDEGHRTQHGNLKTKVDLVFPKACYFAFTGTPLLKREKNTFAKFGGSVDVYSIRTATEDGAVVPLLYDGRLVEQQVNKDPLDLWFERLAKSLTAEQKVDLKKRWSRADVLPQIDPFVRVVAWDVYEDFKRNWKGTGFKAMLVAPRKETAIQYREILRKLAEVDGETGGEPITCEVIISAPQERENEDEPEESGSPKVNAFWSQMMEAWGDEEQYNERIIERFKDTDQIDILIVVSKLLTGFDAPRATSMYIARSLSDHTLLQAIARVNRLYDGKEYGVIVDYMANLGRLDKALNKYLALEGFDFSDIEGAVLDIKTVFGRVKQTYGDLIGLFGGLWDRTHDSETIECYLGNKEIRDEFGDSLRAFQKALHLALTTPRFHEEVEAETIERYLYDLNRFVKLRAATNLRYQETVDFKVLEPQIRKLLSEYVSAIDVRKLTLAPFDMLDQVKRDELLGDMEPAAQADLVASQTRKRIEIDLRDADPVLYKKFSEMLQSVIDEFRQGALAQIGGAYEYLRRVQTVSNEVSSGGRADVPPMLHARDAARSYYRVLQEWAGGVGFDDKDAVALLALDVENAIDRERCVDWIRKDDVKNQMYKNIDDAFYSFCNEHKLEKQWDAIEQCSRTIVDSIAAARP